MPLGTLSLGRPVPLTFFFLLEWPVFSGGEIPLPHCFFFSFVCSPDKLLVVPSGLCYWVVSLSRMGQSTSDELGSTYKRAMVASALSLKFFVTIWFYGEDP